MRKIIIIFIIICSSFSCIKESVTSTIQIIENSTIHKIEFFLLYDGKLKSYLVLKTNEQKEFSRADFGKSLPSIFLPNRLEIFYDDTISIIHGDIIPVKRDITKLESFQGGIVSEGSDYINYEYKYVFTEADYLEALERHNLNLK